MVFRFTLGLMGSTLLAALFATVAYGQQEPGPVALLQAARRNYSQTSQYHFEVRRSEDFKGELSGNWSDSFQIAIVGSDGRYRFEARGPHYSWVQISNGKTEWLYNALSKEYVRKRAPGGGQPSHFGKDVLSYEQSQLVDAQSIPEHIVDEIGAVRGPELVRSEVLSLGSGSIECFVIHGEGKYRSGWEPDTSWELTLWIEKGSHNVRKIEEHWKGRLIKGDMSYYTRISVELYSVVDLGTPAVPQSLFEFEAPHAARLVARFDQRHALPKPRRSKLIGEVAPDLTLQSTEGGLIHLNSFRGTPTLIEFWATWCAPCIEAFPELEQIYTRATSQGIVVITVDEDSQPEKAAAFLATHRKSSWSNYHDDGEINRSLPGEGLPQFVLIDAGGKIVYANSGFDGPALRTAIGQLVRAHTPLEKKPRN